MKIINWWEKNTTTTKSPFLFDFHSGQVYLSSYTQIYVTSWIIIKLTENVDYHLSHLFSLLILHSKVSKSKVSNNIWYITNNHSTHTISLLSVPLFTLFSFVFLLQTVWTVGFFFTAFRHDFFDEVWAFWCDIWFSISSGFFFFDAFFIPLFWMSLLCFDSPLLLDFMNGWLDVQFSIFTPIFFFGVFFIPLQWLPLLLSLQNFFASSSASTSEVWIKVMFFILNNLHHSKGKHLELTQISIEGFFSFPRVVTISVSFPFCEEFQLSIITLSYIKKLLHNILFLTF